MILMTDIEKINVVKSIVKKSKLDFDIELYRESFQSKNCYYENLMGSDFFFVFSCKVSLDDNEKKELYVIVDESYAFVQTTLVASSNRIDEIARFKKFENNVHLEKAKLIQDGGETKELHSIEEMFKASSTFSDSDILRSSIEVPFEFKFTKGFSNKDIYKETREVKTNLMDKFIKFNSKLREIN